MVANISPKMPKHVLDANTCASVSCLELVFGSIKHQLKTFARERCCSITPGLQARWLGFRCHDVAYYDPCVLLTSMGFKAAPAPTTVRAKMRGTAAHLPISQTDDVWQMMCAAIVRGWYKHTVVHPFMRWCWHEPPMRSNDAWLKLEPCDFRWAQDATRNSRSCLSASSQNWNWTKSPFGPEKVVLFQAGGLHVLAYCLHVRRLVSGSWICKPMRVSRSTLRMVLAQTDARVCLSHSYVTASRASSCLEPAISPRRFSHSHVCHRCGPKCVSAVSAKRENARNKIHG